MRLRVARKILQNAAVELHDSQYRYGPGQICKAMKRIWHSSRYSTGPCEGQRMRLPNDSVRACAKVFTGECLLVDKDALV